MTSINQCDGCMSGHPVRGALHVGEDGKPTMACQKGKYQQGSRAPIDMHVAHAIAHRVASRYAHNSDPRRIEYTFEPHTLEQFVRFIESANGITREQS